MKKNKIVGINFERMVLAFGIITFHYYCHSSSGKKLFLHINTLKVGPIITTCFFILSGAMLFYNHEVVHDITQFYFKRFKSIFPAFWIAYFVEYMRNIVNTNTIFWSSAPKWRLILSISGIDGYLYQYLHGQDYYILGEWFLGAIIILYSIYPLLTWFMQKNFALTTICLYTTYIVYLFSNQSFFFEIIIYITYFYTGMVIFRFKKYFFDNKLALIMSIFLCFLLTIIRTNGCSIFYLVYSAGLFIILQRIGSFIEKWNLAKHISNFVGVISYEIFLVQHIIILRTLSVKNPVNTYKSIALIIIIIFLCIIYAKLLNLTATGAIAMLKKQTK